MSFNNDKDLQNEEKEHRLDQDCRQKLRVNSRRVVETFPSTVRLTLRHSAVCLAAFSPFFFFALVVLQARDALTRIAYTYPHAVLANSHRPSREKNTAETAAPTASD